MSLHADRSRLRKIAWIFSLGLAACTARLQVDASATTHVMLRPTADQALVHHPSLIPSEVSGSAVPILKTGSPGSPSMPKIAAYTATPESSGAPISRNGRKATPTRPPCLDPSGSVISGSLESEFLRLPLEYRVCLPACYETMPGRHYPVLYLIHGQGSDESQWERLGACSAAIDLAWRGEISPMILVLPHDRAYTQPTEDGFGKALAAELAPKIDQEYRTLADRNFRAIGGLSRGGAWAIHLGVKEWQIFGIVGAHSPAIFHTDVRKLAGWLEAIPVSERPVFYIDIGDKDRPELLRLTAWFEDLLTEMRVPHEYYLFPGYHEEAYWQAHVEEYLRWYAQNL